MTNFKQPTVAIKTFGCKVNQYESEVILESLVNKGYKSTDEEDFADVYIINTCTVTSLSDKKSRQYIRRVKRINPNALTCVVGCYAQVAPDEVAKIEGVDIIAGTGEKLRLHEFIEERLSRREKENINKVDSPSCYVRDYSELKEFVDTGAITAMENRTRAYIKIQEGCNQFCTYCIIPYARGSIRSRSPESILREIEILVEKGFKEVVLTGINAALYGREKEFSHKEYDGIIGLLRQIDEIEGDFRVRLSSLEPTVINAEYVSKLFDIKRLCHHLHLSVQSGSNRVLKSMNRHYSREDYLDIVKRLREFDKNYAVTTDIIVGFPNETESDFRDSEDIIKESEFSHCHIFPYSIRQGTPAAEMKNHVDSCVKNDRVKELIRIAEATEHKFKENMRGETVVILIEEYVEEYKAYRGFSDNYTRCYVKMDEPKNFEKIKKIIANTENGDILNSFIKAQVRGVLGDGVECIL